MRKPARRTSAALALGLLLALSAWPAGAVTLPVEIELRLDVATISPLVLTSVGAATLNGSGPGGHLSSLALAASQVAGATLVPITDPGAAPITGARLTGANGPGTISETAGGALRGAIGLLGAAKVCLFGSGGCSGALANVTIPLSVVGAGGFQYASAAVNLTVFGAPWTRDQAAIGTITRMGFARGPASATSSTAQPGGALQLVTPVHISTSIAASAVIPIFATLSMQFVPEPGTLALLAVGFAGLAFAGGRRRADR